jgi:hypothetical protein
MKGKMKHQLPIRILTHPSPTIYRSIYGKNTLRLFGMTLTIQERFNIPLQGIQMMKNIFALYNLIPLKE